MDELISEFSNEFRKTSGLIAFAHFGIKQFAESIPWLISEENPDPKMNLGSTPPTAENARAAATWHKSELESAVAPQGWLQQITSQGWITATHSRWEFYYRPKIAKLFEVSVGSVLSDAMADINNLRNDIIHHGGKASKKNTGKNKVLTRFSVGEEIILSEDDIWLLEDNLFIEIVSFHVRTRIFAGSPHL